MLSRKLISKLSVNKLQRFVTSCKCKYSVRNISLFPMRHLQLSNRDRTRKIPEFGMENDNFQNYLESLRKEFYALRVNTPSNSAAYSRMTQLSGIVTSLEQYRVLQGNMTSQEDIENEKDEDMKQLIKEENEVYSNLLRKTEEDLMSQMLSLTDEEHYPSVIFEVNAGAGGQEAMLFAKDLFDMYTNYFEYNGWPYEIHEQDATDIGGLRHANVIINDSDAFNNLRYEAGVHRIQRVPSTEKAGRIHTSTASVTVIPCPADVNITIAEKDLKIETKRASGAGGQHVNTTDSAVRMVHLPTGIAIECQTDRSQFKNREIALKRLQAQLMKAAVEAAESSKQATRKAQQGNLNRNEKIRTYNFVQDRITDHRIKNGTMHNLEELLEGGEHLETLIQRVVLDNRKAKLAEMVENWKEQNKPPVNSPQKTKQGVN